MLKIQQIKQANIAAGHHFFDERTMQAFDSWVYKDVYGGRFFVTREAQFKSDLPHRFTIREAKPDGSIDTIGELQEYETLDEAQATAKMLAYMGDRPLGCYKNIKEVEKCNLLVGDSFFSSSDMETYDRVVVSKLYGGSIFITREITKFSTTDEEDTYKYVIWQCLDCAHIIQIDTCYTQGVAERLANNHKHFSAKWPLYTNVEQIKEANTRAGEYYFTPSAMRGFNSRIGSRIYGGKYFLVSKLPPHSRRVYDVYEATKKGKIIRLPERMNLSYYKAVKLAKELGQAEDEKYADYYR